MSKPKLRQKRGKPHCAPSERANLNSFEAIVHHYIECRRECAAKELAYYAFQPSLEVTIELAALAKLENGKRHPHQYRIPKEALEEASEHLLRASLDKCKSFDELHHTVNSKIRNINGIGRLTVYDTATRIGAYLKIKPQLIYLHQGTEVGAKAVVNLKRKQKTLKTKDLPEPFQLLEPHEIEDCLCIYADELKQLKDSI
jgi:hypothetical protein